jgi:hypothetical protein
MIGRYKHVAPNGAAMHAAMIKAAHQFGQVLDKLPKHEKPED